MLKAWLIGTALAIALSGCKSPESQTTAVANEPLQVEAEPPRWQMRTSGHVFFPLLSSTVVSSVASLDREELSGQNDHALQSAVGAWYDGLPVPANEIHVLGFEGNALKVQRPGDAALTWYVPLRFVSTVTEREYSTSESGLPEGRVAFQWPPDHFVATATLTHISEKGECELTTPDGTVLMALPVLFTWCWDRTNAKQLHVYFGHAVEDDWPRDRLDSGDRYQFWSMDRLTASRLR